MKLTIEYFKIIDFMAAMSATITTLLILGAFPIICLAWGKSGGTTLSLFLTVSTGYILLIGCAICLWNVWQSDGEILKEGIKGRPYSMAFFVTGFLLFSFFSIGVIEVATSLAEYLYVFVPMIVLLGICKDLIKLIKYSINQKTSEKKDQG